MTRTKSKITESSGNVFKDLGLNNADELSAKSGLVFRIAQIIEKRNLTQMAAANILGVDQPKICSLLKGQLEGFSTERLFRFLNSLDQDVLITVKPKSRSARCGEVRVLAA
jgi:predicted XRE-type DNA-binding protein